MRKLVWAMSVALVAMSGHAVAAGVTVLTAAKIHTMDTAHPTASEAKEATTQVHDKPPAEPPPAPVF